MNIEEVLKIRWVWKARGRYGWNAVDQYNSLEESNATYSGVDLMATFQDSGTAEQVATAMNKAYAAGVERGQAEMLAALYGQADAMDPEQGNMLREQLDAFLTTLL